MIGSLSVGVVGGLMGQESPEGFEMEFFATYLTTILQGILLNGVLVPYGLIVLVIVKFTIRATSPQAIELSGESKDTVSAE